MGVLSSFASAPFRRVVWLLPLALCLHELEEWNVRAWEVTFFENPPVASDTALRIVLVLISASGVLWTWVACSLPTVRATAIATLFGFGIVTVGNSLQHLYWQTLSDGYAPGAFTSAIVCLPAMALVLWSAIRNRLIGTRHLAALSCMWLLMLVGIVQIGREMPSQIQALHRVGMQLEMHLDH